MTLRIREVVPVTERARVVRIALGGKAFPYRAGQALMVARHRCERRRPYSIAAAPADVEQAGQLELLVGVDALGTPGSHLDLEPGALVDVEGPIGRFTFPDEPKERRFVFIAGGTGIAPLRAMLRQALKTPHQQIGLLYSARTPNDFAYDSELDGLAKEGRIELRKIVTRDMGSANWTGKRGRIGREDLIPLVDDLATLYFVCGPPAMVREIPQLLEMLGAPRDRVRVEESERKAAPQLGSVATLSRIAR